MVWCPSSRLRSDREACPVQGNVTPTTITTAGDPPMSFEIATWYDTWNGTGLENLAQGKVPLNYATRYNLAFSVFEQGANGYSLNLNGAFASQVLTLIRAQASNVLIY